MTKWSGSEPGTDEVLQRSSDKEQCKPEEEAEEESKEKRAHVQFVAYGLFTELITTKTPRWESKFTKNAFYFIFLLIGMTQLKKSNRECRE